MCSGMDHRRALTVSPRRISIYSGAQERLYHHKRRLLSRSAGAVADILSRRYVSPFDLWKTIRSRCSYFLIPLSVSTSTDSTAPDLQLRKVLKIAYIPRLARSFTEAYQTKICDDVLRDYGRNDCPKKPEACRTIGIPQ